VPAQVKMGREAKDEDEIAWSVAGDEVGDVDPVIGSGETNLARSHERHRSPGLLRERSNEAVLDVDTRRHVRQFCVKVRYPGDSLIPVPT
ncbi:MAG: hypothetical protein QOC92_785, partial [Acidimicrobiaceae bacterium]